jgi:mRNA-degrading endonuclease RelE of RelBE toxin-antitoxin system
VSLTVIYRETALPGLKRILAADKDKFARDRRAIRALERDPYPDEAVPWGKSGIWRLHAGDVRVLYEVDEEAGAVYVLSVGLVT